VSLDAPRSPGASRDRVRPRRRTSGLRAHRFGLDWQVILVTLMVAHVVLKVLLLPRTAHGEAVGDETFYLDGGRALSNLVRDVVALRSPDSAQLGRDVVGNGWFMPGMSVVLTPLFIVDPHASIEVTRAYLGLMSTVLLFAAVLAVRRVLGVRYAVALMVFPGLVPMWIIFSFAAWGDLAAGVMIVFLLVELVVISRLVQQGIAPGLRHGARLGLVAIGPVYLRSSALALVLALVAALALFAVLVLPRGRRVRGLGAFAAAAAVFGVLLAPWSWAVSQAMDAPVLTTTSVPTALANTFGERDRLCFGPCDPDSSEWFSPVRYAREVARATGLSEVEVLQQMSDYALVGVTPSSYADDVMANVERYVMEPERFQRFIRSPGVSEDDPSEQLLSTVSRWMFFAVLVAGVLGMLSAWRRPLERQILRIATTIALAALFTQPLVHVAGARYWTTAAPLLALSASLLWPGVPSGFASVREATAMRWLFLTQIALTAVIISTATIIYTVAKA
jgi:hypothetical protein